MQRSLALAAALLLALPAHATTLKVGVGQGLVNPDPHTSSLYSDVRILEQIYQGLLKLDPATLKPVGDLADSWTISDDQLTWTFKLHPGVTFHDGRPLTAADVVYSFNHIRNPKTVATLLSDFEPIAAVEAPDPATVVIKLQRPYGVLPAVLAAPVWSAVVPANATDLAGHPLGTGPFAFVSQVAKTSVSLKKNPAFQDPGLPKVDGIEFVVVPDESARIAALVSGQVQVIDTVAMAQARQLAGTKGVKLLRFDSAWVDEFGFNTTRKPFDDVRVRRALALAINKDQVTKAATFGLGKPAATMVGLSSIPIDVQPIAFDPAEAKRLLQQAGVTNLSFTFAPCGGTSFPQMTRAGEVISANLRSIGVDAQMTSMDAGVWGDTVINRRDYAAFICGLINGTDPDQRSFRYFSKGGVYNFSNFDPGAELDGLLHKAREEADPGLRGQLYTQIFGQLNQDVPWVPLYVVPGLVGVSDKVSGLVVTPNTDLVLLGASLTE